MKVRKRILRVLCAAAVFIFAAGLFVGCDVKKVEAIRSFDDLHKPDVKIGLSTDMPEYDMLKIDYPDADVIITNDYQLAYKDVANGRLDAYFYSRIEMEFAIENGTKGVRLLDDDYSARTVAVGLSPRSRVPDIRSKVNTFISELRADGTLDEMYERWVILGEDSIPYIPAPSDTSLKLRVGTTGTVMPFSYYKDNKLNGYDIELAYRFGAWLGASVEFKVYDFGGIVAAAESGDIDCIMSNLYKTEENSEAIPFSDTLFDIEITAMVRDTGDSGITSLSDLEHSSIAVETGTNFPQHVLKSLPEANIVYYNNTADQVNALKNGKVDAVAYDEPAARYLMNQDDSVTFLPELLESVDYGFIFQMNGEGEKLRDQLNDYLAKIKSDGTMESLQKKWFEAADVSSVEKSDYRALPDAVGTLKLATAQNPPFSMSVDEQLCGYDIDLFSGFCEEYGYALEVTDVSMDALLSAVQSGKYDAACCGISITEERKESMLFSDPDYSGGTVLVVRKEGAEVSGAGFFTSIGVNFEKTFIRENRWKMFLSGIGTTLLITVLSVILGTILGFAVFMGCRKGNRVANAITNFCIWLIHGMPVVVLLMILYYIIFGKVDISGTIVSIIGFTLIFASAVFNMVKSGVGAIDKGQKEAAYALGFSDRRAFYRVIFPQALPHFMPAYKGEITSLIKATAIVGYVTVQDLTKMGDIVRSRTYDAFFPLISVAIIYFILAAILTFIVDKIEIRVDPRRRSPEKIMKEVSGK